MKGPLIAKRKNEGLPLTGDELCWHERKTPTNWKKGFKYLAAVNVYVWSSDSR